MKIRIEKKNDDQYLVLFSDGEKEVKGIYLSKSEIKKLKADLDQMLEYDVNEVGDSI